MERKDKFFKKAKKEGYVARSAYKLIQLNKKYNIIKGGDKVLDLGCSPGSWVQVALQLKASRVIGIDLEKVKVKNKVFNFMMDDINKIDIKKIGDVDVVLSDIAPCVSGIKNIDTEESIELSNKAFNITKKVLKKNGNFLCKVFMGKGYDVFLKEVKSKFEFCKSSRPTATRKNSKEIYIIAKGFK